MRARPAVACLLALLVPASAASQRPPVDFEALPHAPRTAICYRASAPLTIDGRLDEPAWQATAWSAPFVDIDGVRPVRHATRVKLLWDDQALYIAAQLDEPDLWATLTKRDLIAGAASVPFVEDRNDRVKWALRRLYYRQRRHRATHGHYATDLAALRASDIRVDGLDFRPVLHGTPSLYELIAPGFDGASVHLTQDGRVWVKREPIAARP